MLLIKERPVFSELLNPHGSDETYLAEEETLLVEYLLNPHGSDETKGVSINKLAEELFLTHTVQMKLIEKADVDTLKETS